MELYWLHCTGPDGPCVLLATYDTRTLEYDLIDDGRTCREHEVDGKTWLHKWVLIRREEIVRPDFKGE